MSHPTAAAVREDTPISRAMSGQREALEGLHNLIESLSYRLSPVRLERPTGSSGQSSDPVPSRSPLLAEIERSTEHISVCISRLRELQESLEV
jgi:hypothetical protein